ncbi:MAG TPA: hypothetical protein VMJ34_16810, partial [Bryobacteraceae bacterium]|nr:hypothetical protein [Bryobacteraceae bacterium]
GQVSLTGMSPAGEVDFSAGFYSTDLGSLINSTSRLNPPPGSCSVAVSRVGANAPPPGTGLNAGDAITVTGPAGLLSAGTTSSGGYFMAKSPARLSQGSYSFASNGGGDVGAFTASLNMTAPAAWTNMAAYTGGTLNGTNPLIFTWTGGDPAGYVTASIASANSTYNSVLQCNATASANTLTVPASLLRAVFPGPITVSLTSTSAPVSFKASGLDTGSITATAGASTQMTFSPAQ